MFDRQPFLSGELLELRPLRAGDFDALFQVAADPLIWEQHPESDRYQEVTFRKFFAEALESGGALVALDRATGHIIGSSRYHGYDAERSVVEIGWTFLARAYWGGRYNGEMKRLMLEHAFKSVQRVIFIIGPDNRRSRRAVEKIGAAFAGTTRDARGRERVMYELNPSSYAPRSEHAPHSQGQRMSKGRNPRKQKAEPEKEVARETTAPALLPPTAVSSENQPQPVLFQVVQTLRFAAEKIVDLADAVADAIMRRIEGRA
jgi:N-acetyltransferase